MHNPDFAAILESIEPSRREAAATLLQKQLAACIACKFEPTNVPAKLGSRIGGTALLPTDLPHPCDRSGKPMLFIAQINFAELPNAAFHLAKRGLLILFWNSARDHSNPKDRHAFRCVWLPQAEEKSFVDSSFDSAIGPCTNLSFSEAWSLPEYDSAWSDQGLESDLRKQITEHLRQGRRMQILGQAGRQFDILQEIASFAGNGISWSQARRGDACFSHLLDNSRDWKLLMQIGSVPESGLDLGALSMYLLIRQDDLEQHNYDKSWLLVA